MGANNLFQIFQQYSLLPSKWLVSQASFAKDVASKISEQSETWNPVLYGTMGTKGGYLCMSSRLGEAPFRPKNGFRLASKSFWGVGGGTRPLLGWEGGGGTRLCSWMIYNHIPDSLSQFLSYVMFTVLCVFTFTSQLSCCMRSWKWQNAWTKLPPLLLSYSMSYAWCMGGFQQGHC